VPKNLRPAFALISLHMATFLISSACFRLLQIARSPTATTYAPVRGVGWLLVRQNAVIDSHSYGASKSKRYLLVSDVLKSTRPFILRLLLRRRRPAQPRMPCLFVCGKQLFFFERLEACRSTDEAPTVIIFVAVPQRQYVIDKVV